MYEFLERLRKKPVQLRVMAAFWGAAIFSALVAVVWSLSLPGRMSSMNLLTEETEVRPDGWFANVRNSFADIQAQFTTEEPAVEATSEAVIGPKEVDLTTLTASSATATSTQAETNEGTWSRTYENKPGRTVQVATSSRDSNSATVVQ